MTAGPGGDAPNITRAAARAWSPGPPRRASAHPSARGEREPTGAGCVVLQCPAHGLRAERLGGEGPQQRQEAGHQDGLIESDVRGHCDAITYPQTARLFQRKTGMHKSMELTAERVKVLRNVHIEKGQF